MLFKTRNSTLWQLPGFQPDYLALTRDAAQHLAERLHEVLSNTDLRRRLAEVGQRNVLSTRSAEVMAERTVHVLREVIERRHPSASSAQACRT